LGDDKGHIFFSVSAGVVGGYLMIADKNDQN